MDISTAGKKQPHESTDSSPAARKQPHESTDSSSMEQRGSGSSSRKKYSKIEAVYVISPKSI